MKNRLMSYKPVDNTKLNFGVKTTGSYKGKSNKLGHGGRAQQLKDEGVPGGMIGNLARKAQAAPGQKNFHGKKKTNKFAKKAAAALAK